MNREEIEEKYKWDLTRAFDSDEAWEAEYESLKNGCDFTKYKGKLSEKKTLLDLFAEQTEFFRRVEKLYLYAHTKHDQDVRVTKYVSFTARAQSLYAEASSQLSFVDPELLKLSDKKLKALAKDPDFKDYDYSLSRLIEQKAHTLNAESEKVLALASEPLGSFYDIFSMLDNADLPLPMTRMNGENVKLSHGVYGLIMHSENRAERKAAFKAYYKAYGSLLNVLAANYIGNVKKDVFYSKARKFNGCLEMALFNEDVPPVVYDNLIASVHGALPELHRYVSLRKKELGFTKQHMYDLHVSLVENVDLKMSYEDAYKTVIEGLAPLGKDYQALLQRAYDERWIDVCENEGKRSGAYSTGCYDTHPYVLLNYQQTTNEIFTIAHEMGHSIHSYKSNAAQPYAKAQYTIFLAEIASTVNEVLLLKYLYGKAEDKKLKKFLLNYYIETFRATLFRQTQFAEFEQIAHAKAESGEALTKESLNEVYYELNKKYYGKGIVHDEEIAYEWARIPHFYTSFYVYKYATGIISAVSIAKRILSEGEIAVQDYFKFLSGGGMTKPVEILKLAGVDLTSEQPFKTAMEEFKETLDQFIALEKE